MEPNFTVVTKPGFHEGAFVYPDGTCIPSTTDFRVCLPENFERYADKFHSHGSLEGWLRIPEMARGNSRLMLAIALAFTGPVIDLLDVEVPMIQLCGAPGSGKTSIAIAAGSVWGGGQDGFFLESWDNTVNNLELVAAAHHATFLLLDETRLIDQSQSRKSGAIFDAIMRLAEGWVKGRMLNSQTYFRSKAPMLSTTNQSLDEMALQNGLMIDDAIRGRLIDVPVSNTSGGAFQSLHEFRDKTSFVVELLRTCKTNNGFAAEEFLRRITLSCARDEESLVRRLSRCREYYLSRAKRRVASATRDLDRLHQKFATIYAAASSLSD